MACKECDVPGVNVNERKGWHDVSDSVRKKKETDIKCMLTTDGVTSKTKPCDDASVTMCKGPTVDPPEWYDADSSGDVLKAADCLSGVTATDKMKV